MTEQENLLDHGTGIHLPAELPSSIGKNWVEAQKPDRSYQKSSFGFRVWKSLSFFRRDDIKFAIKVGVGAALFAAPSFATFSRPFYQHWRGEWGLLSFMLVCSMTIGTSNTTGYSRFIGTGIGAITAIVAWIAAQDHVLLLAGYGWLMSVWTAYIILAKSQGPFGRFVMLTYNLTALYAYSLSARDNDDDGDEGGINPIITEIALHRVVSVLAGCLWGLVITRFVWPISARTKMKTGLSLLWLRMSLIWKRDPLAVLLDGESRHHYMNIREEFELQKFLSRLEEYRIAAAYEFELKGPFPAAIYSRLLKSTNRMLDAFHAMNVLILKDGTSQGKVDVLRHTSHERAQLCSRISHLFQGRFCKIVPRGALLTPRAVLASSMKLEFPLSDALPSTEHARDRLLAKIHTLRKSNRAPRKSNDEDFALLYAYGNHALHEDNGRS